MKVLKWAALAAVAAAVGIQFLPGGARTNPPVTGEIQAPPEVLFILRRSCYDCHSNETRWPWYARVAPVSWLIARDVGGARFKMNFSTWSAIPEPNPMLYRHEIVKNVEARKMPLPRYLWMHPDARLSAADRDLLRRWAGSPGGTGPEAGGLDRTPSD